MCMIDNSDPCDIYNSVTRKARKLHRCSECRRDIQLGETYTYATMLYDGAWSTYRMCAHCVAVAQWLAKVCGGWLHCGVYEDLQEHFEEGYNRRWLAVALSGMRRKWRRKDGRMWRPMSLPKNLPIPEAH